GSAVTISCDKIIDKGKKIAAHMMEAAVADIEFDAKGSLFRVAGTDRKVPLLEVAKASFARSRIPADLEVGLMELTDYSPEVPNFPTGCHICEVEIDPETGKTEVLKYCVVDDVGTVINKLTLEGQIHGGIGQGVGQAFTEHMIYDPDSGQLLT